MLTGRAAQAFHSGRFDLQVVQGPGEVSSTQATALAAAYVRTFGKYLAADFTRERGAPVHVAALGPCGVPQYATSRFQELAAGNPEGAHRYAGPKWLVPMCENGTAEVLIAVSAYAGEIALDGGLIRQMTIPSDFISRGIPVGVDVLPVTPEAAAAIAAKETGRRIAAVPELVLPPVPYAPILAKWRITLDAPVAVHGTRSGQDRAVSEIWVGPAESSHSVVIGTDDPRPATGAALSLPGPTGARLNIPLTTKPNYPGTYEPVTVRP